MNRPYIICHMVTSIDGKVTGTFLSRPACEAAVQTYYDIHRRAKADGFICGRVTMEGSFTGGWYPDLTACRPAPVGHDFVPKDAASAFYAIAFDTNGKLGWVSNTVIDPDGDPGYDGARIVEVLSENVDERYLGYLQEKQIPYLFAGEEVIDVPLALAKLKQLFGMETLLLEGGSVINGAFQRADAVDELSLVVAPLAANADDKPLFFGGKENDFTLVSAATIGEAVVLRYVK